MEPVSHQIAATDLFKMNSRPVATPAVHHSILIIDDDAEISEVMALIATDLKFSPYTAKTAVEGLALARELKPSIIFLDVQMPDMDGFKVCRQLRASPETREVPILMITGSTDVESRVRGLDIGADDYLLKPFYPREVAARVRALLRRKTKLASQDSEAESPVVLGNLTVTPVSHSATLGNKTLNLTGTELKILTRLLWNLDQVLEKKEFLKDVWGATTVTVRTIDTHVANLRRKLRGWTHAIETIHGVGYIVRATSLSDTPIQS